MNNLFFQNVFVINVIISLNDCKNELIRLKSCKIKNFFANLPLFEQIQTRFYPTNMFSKIKYIFSNSMKHDFFY